MADEKPKTTTPQAPTAQNREAQVRKYIDENRYNLAGENINPHGHKAYFDTGKKTIVFEGDYKGFTTVIDHRHDTTERETLIPEGAKRLNVHYVASPNHTDTVELKGDAVTLLTHGSAEKGYYADKVEVYGDRNLLAFDAVSTAANVTVFGDRNRVFGTKGDDNFHVLGDGSEVRSGAGNDGILLSNGGGNGVWAGDGDDTIEDSVFQSSDSPIQTYNQERRKNSVLGGKGIDTYQLGISLSNGPENKAKDDYTNYNFRFIDVAFDAKGNALIKDGDTTLARVAHDVERLELKVNGVGKDKLGTDFSAANGIYQLEFSKLRQAFKDANVRMSGEAVPDIKPLTIHVNSFGVSFSSDAGDNVPVKKVSRTPY